jgi:Ca-dependent carbohydrate-binding module xylan-binding
MPCQIPRRSEAWAVSNSGISFLLCATFACVSLLTLLFCEEARAATAKVEAETMTLSGSSVAVNPNGAASGGQAVAFYSKGSAASAFDGTPTSITLHARGRACQGNPHLGVYVDGTLQSAAELTSNTFADYAIPLDGLSAGAHTLRVAYQDDYSGGTCDRNAYLDFYTLALPEAQQPPTADPVLVGAGKIGACDSPGDEATAKLLDSIAGTVFTAGDNAFSSGTAAQFANCYGPTWGRHKARTMPAPGNHDYDTVAASGYFGYFGSAAGDPTKGYYSYDLGQWHVVSLNSNCAYLAGGCGATSPMVAWLRQDLAANPTTCTIAYFNHPLFSSGNHGNQPDMRPIWDALYAADADVVVNGRDHDYERFAPQDPSGVADPARGIRQFVVGTGGAHHAAFGTIKPNSEVRKPDTYGVLKVTLHPTSYDWRFVPEAGKSFADSGSTGCH